MPLAFCGGVAMIPPRLSALRTLVIWVLAAYAAVLAVGTGHTQFSFSWQSEAVARDAHAQVATLRGLAESEAPTDPDGEWPVLPPEGVQIQVRVPKLALFHAASQAAVFSPASPTPIARGPPRHS